MKSLLIVISVLFTILFTKCTHKTVSQSTIVSADSLLHVDSLNKYCLLETYSNDSLVFKPVYTSRDITIDSLVRATLTKSTSHVWIASPDNEGVLPFLEEYSYQWHNSQFRIKSRQDNRSYIVDNGVLKKTGQNSFDPVLDCKIDVRPSPMIIGEHYDYYYQVTRIVDSGKPAPPLVGTYIKVEFNTDATDLAFDKSITDYMKTHEHRKPASVLFTGDLSYKSYGLAEINEAYVIKVSGFSW